MTRSRLYLSGAMEFADDGNLGADWRLDCTKRLDDLGYTAIDITAFDVSYSSQHGDLFRCTAPEDNSYDEHLQRKANIRQHFVHADLQLIEHHTDAMIVKYCGGARRGAGTISECQVSYNLGIPIFLVNTFKDNRELPGWLFALTTKIFNSFDELYEYLSKLPEGILRLDRYGNRRSGMHYLCSLCGAVEEKHKAHFVSKVSPLYCKSCVDLVKTTNETHVDRYEFFVDQMERAANCFTYSLSAKEQDCMKQALIRSVVVLNQQNSAPDRPLRRETDVLFENDQFRNCDCQCACGEDFECGC